MLYYWKTEWRCGHSYSRAQNLDLTLIPGMWLSCHPVPKLADILLRPLYRECRKSERANLRNLTFAQLQISLSGHPSHNVLYMVFLPCRLNIWRGNGIALPSPLSQMCLWGQEPSQQPEWHFPMVSSACTLQTHRMLWSENSASWWKGAIPMEPIKSWF